MLPLKNYRYRFNAIALFFALVISVVLISNHRFFNSQVTEDINTYIDLNSDLVSEQVSNKLYRNAQIVNDVALYIQSNPNLIQQDLLTYLEAILDNTDDIQSIYYGTNGNQFLTGSGWIPPNTFNVTKRPWYTLASDQRTLVFTNLYLNASNNKKIITIAKAVVDNNNFVKGVVGADLYFENIAPLVEHTSNNTGLTILLDENQEIIANSKAADRNRTSYLKDLSVDLYNAYIEKNFTTIPTEINGEKGYGKLSEIQGTELTLCSFIPLSAFDAYQNRWNAFSALTFIVLFGVIITTYFLQRRLLIKPVITLQEDINKISMSENPSYRLTNQDGDPFYYIKHYINQALSETDHLLLDIKNSRKEIISSNIELKKYSEKLELRENELLQEKLKLEISEQRHKAILSVLPDLIFIYNSNGDFLDCQTKNESLLLASRNEFIGKNIRAIMPSEISEGALICINETLASDETKRFEYQLMIQDRSKTFETRMIKYSANEVLAIVRDITFEKHEQDIILELSYTDQLTGLYNRRYFDEELSKMDSPDYLPLAIIMMDVNGLKLTNDAFGHLLGDALLKRVAQIINDNVVEKGFVSRIGGDEFVMICPNTTHARAQQIVDRMYDKIENERLNNSIVISISAGWEIRNSIEQSIRDTFIKAENHMFRKKIVESQSMRNQTIQVIMQTLGEKSKREKRHSLEVAEWSKRIGQAMHLNSQTIKELETAGLLHDIGKISVKETILNKAGKLTEEEYHEMKRHSESGYHILKSVDAYASLAECILEHHEWYDGKGYPRGLKGENISLTARVICVADAYVAMTEDRTYREAMHHDEAIAEVIKHAGTQFDPKVVDTFLSLFNQKD